MATREKQKEVRIDPYTFVKRLHENQEFMYEWNVNNPFLLAVLYYTEGMSTTEIAELLGVHDRTVRRRMNYYGFRRFTKRFSQLVKLHGIEKARQIEEPTFYPLGRWDD